MSKYAIVTRLGTSEDITALARRTAKDYKHAAALASRAVKDGVRRWAYLSYEPFDVIEVAPGGGVYPVARWDGAFKYDEVVIGSDTYPKLMYIGAACQNAAAELRAYADEWLTPSEIETLANLRPGTVRQYIGRNRETLMLKDAIKDADQRTVLMRRGEAMDVWSLKVTHSDYSTDSIARELTVQDGYLMRLKPEHLALLKPLFDSGERIVAEAQHLGSTIKVIAQRHGTTMFYSVNGDYAGRLEQSGVFAVNWREATDLNYAALYVLVKHMEAHA